MYTRTITTIEELSDVASEILGMCISNDRAQVIALKGDLGAGKTAFVKELAHHLGVAYEITSPTFVVMKSYPIPAHHLFDTLTHIDAYRIESEDEMGVLGFVEILADARRLVCIEWPERIASWVPKDALIVEITLKADGSRDISYGI